MKTRKKRIGIIQAGGTILSIEGEDGKAPGVSVETIYSTYIPKRRQKKLDEIHERTETIKPFGEFGIDSSLMTDKDIANIGQVINEHYHKFDAFLIAHGTDTMAKTSNALSYMFHDAKKPIVVTGSQYAPSEKPVIDGKKYNSDAGQNLGDAIEVASKSQPGVHLVFNGNVISGARAYKQDAEKFNAFISVNKKAKSVKEATQEMDCAYKGPTSNRFGAFNCRYNAKVSYIKATTDIEDTIDDINSKFEKGRDAIIFEAFGTGNTHGKIFDTLEEWIKKGKTVVMATQCVEGIVDSTAYEAGRRAIEIGTLCGLDMSNEAIEAKLKYAYSNLPVKGVAGKELLKEFWYKNVADELNPKLASKYLSKEREILGKKAVDEMKQYVNTPNNQIDLFEAKRA